MRAISRSICGLALVCACGPVLGAESVETAVKFANGLSEKGYYDLATEQFRKLKWTSQPKFETRKEIVDGLVRNFQAAAEAAPTPAAALGSMRLAAREMGDLLQKAKVPAKALNALEMGYGQLLLDVGRLAGEAMRRKSKDVDLAAVGAEGQRAFGQAASVFLKLARRCEAELTRVTKKEDVDDKDRRIRKESLVGQVAAQTQLGWALYRQAQLSRQLGNSAAFKKELDAASTIFKKQADEHGNLVAGCSAALGRALCLQELGRHKEAIASFNSALTAQSVSRNWDAKRMVFSMRFQAYYDKAASQAALGDFRGALETLAELKREGRLPRDLAQIRDMRRARILGRYADYLRKGAEKSAKEASALAKKRDPKSSRKADLLKKNASELGAQAKGRYIEAVRAVRKIATTESPFTEEAKLLLGKWIAAGGLKPPPRAVDFFADGERLYAAGEWRQAIAKYREALSRARDPGEGRPMPALCQDAWIKMGMAYHHLKRYYEAGLALGQVARVDPEHCPFAGKAAVYSSMFLGAQYARDRTPLGAKTFLDAQELLVERFPDTQAAKKAALRLGDVRRGQKEYQRAAHFYSKVDRASQFYERASYLSGWCLWEAFLASAKKKGGAAAGRRLLDEAETRLEAFVRWAETRPAGTGSSAVNREVYLAKSRLLLARVFLEQKRYKDVLAALSDRALARFRRLPAAEAGLAADASLRRIRALCALRTEAYALKAGKEVEAFRADKRIKDEMKTAAARLVGATFLALSDAHAKAGKLKRGRQDATMRELLRLGRKYLVLSIDLSPRKAVDEYSEVASALYEAGAYLDAAGVFQRLVKRFAKRTQDKDVVRDARRWVARSYEKAGEYRDAAREYASLVKDFPKWMDARRELALCCENEKLKRYRQAEVQWRVLEETFPMGSKKWFEARYHRIDDLIRDKRSALAFQLLASAVIPYPDLGGPPSRDKILQIVNEKLSKEDKAKFLALRKEALQ